MNSVEKGERAANNGGIYSGQHVLKLGRTKKQKGKRKDKKKSGKRKSIAKEDRRKYRGWQGLKLCIGMITKGKGDKEVSRLL